MGFTLRELLVVMMVLFFGIMWLVNAAKLASCDFTHNYRCEIIHGAGLVVPALSIATVWFKDDGA